MATAAPAGLREQKKRATRARISEVATGLFLRRGFDQVTITEVASAAGVSKMTVTNYFPLKEDLVFDRADEIAAMPVTALEARPAGEALAPALHGAYRAALAARSPVLGFRGRTFGEMVQASPALRARERAMFDAQEAAVASRLREEGRPEWDAALAAAQVGAVFRALYHEGRRRLLAGEAEDAIVRALEQASDAAFAAAGRALEAGC